MLPREVEGRAGVARSETRVYEPVLEFTVTEEHLALLRHAYVGWQPTEFGAPEIDPKRPYGHSDVLADIAEVLGIEPSGPDSSSSDPEFSDEQVTRMERAHYGTAFALQIVLQRGEFEAGAYRCVGYENVWERVP